MEVGFSPGDFVLDGDPVPLPKKGSGAPPPAKKSAHVYCGQTAAGIKAALGVEAGLSPNDFVLDGDPAPSPKKGGGALLSNFRPMSIVAKRPDASGCHLVWR